MIPFKSRPSLQNSQSKPMVIVNKLSLKSIQGFWALVQEHECWIGRDLAKANAIKTL